MPRVPAEVTIVRSCTPTSLHVSPDSASRLGPLRAAEIVTSIERLRGYLRFNTNRTLIAESLLAAVAGGPIP